MDHTGLTGIFEIRLEWAKEGSPSEAALAAAAGIDRVITAVENQLGLVLTPQDEAVDALVIDYAERPVMDS